METKKDEFFLTFAMRKPLDRINSKNAYDENNDYDRYCASMGYYCALDNNLIKNQYISDKGFHNWIGNEADKDKMRNFKCFSLHPVVNKKDIGSYDYGDVGYDLNPESMIVYLGGWWDLSSNYKSNKLIGMLSEFKEKGKGKIDKDNFFQYNKAGLSYIDGTGKVYEKMNKKVLNRAKLLLDAIEKIVPSKKPEEIKKHINEINEYIFKNSDISLDDSFDAKQYGVTIDKYDDKNLILQCTFKVNNKVASDVTNTYGFAISCPFNLSYNMEKSEFSLSGNELNGIGKDREKGIKVDRIFIKKEHLEKLQKIQQTGHRHSKIYDNYINRLTEVLIKQFPLGNIRVIDGQDFQFLKPEEFINKYFTNKEDKTKYLEELEKNKKSANEKIKSAENNFKEYDQKQMNNTKNGKVKNLKNKDKDACCCEIF